jgi:hypothetical protein
VEEWLRTGTLKRKANKTGDVNLNCGTRVVTASKCGTIKVEEASSSKKNYSMKYDSSYFTNGV